MDFNEIVEKFKNPDDVTDMFDPADINANKGAAAVSCVPALFWIALVAGNSPFGKFYANQGLTLLILGFASGIASVILSAILGLIPFIGTILSALISLICSLIPFAGFIFALVNALNGKAKPLPLIGTLVNPFK